MYTQTAAAQRSTDPAVWVLIAVIVAMVAGGLGWAVASQSRTSWSDVEQASALARERGQLRGQDRGFAEGTRAGRREAKLAARASSTRVEQTAYADGWRAGVADGRAQAQARYDGDMSFLGIGGPTTSDQSIDELIASTQLEMDAPVNPMTVPAGYGAGYGVGMGLSRYDIASNGLRDERDGWRR